MELAPGGCEGIFVRRVDSTGDGGEVVAVFQSAGIQTRGKGGVGGWGRGKAYGYVLTLSLRRNRATLGLDNSSSENLKMSDETTFLFRFWSAISITCGVDLNDHANLVQGLAR